MGRIGADRVVRKLEEAQGYLMLDLPARALEILQARDEWSTMRFEANLLTGEAHRALGQYREALVPLEAAAALKPGDLAAAVALGWCYKRTHRLAQAIDALERAARHNPGEAILSYNLACYWSLAGDPAKALRALGEAVELDPDYAEQAAREVDFDPIRHHPDFEKAILGRTPA